MNRYSEQDLEQLKQLFAEHWSLEEIAHKLGRSRGSVSQRVHRMQLKRDSRFVHVAAQYGRDALTLAKTPESIISAIKRQAAFEKKKKRMERVAREKLILMAMKANLKRLPRKDALGLAARAGASYSAIARTLGVSRQAVTEMIKR